MGGSTARSRESAGGETGGLAAVVYRSRAIEALSPPELLALTRAARERNEREAVTGVMVYDHRNFYQWLEGPGEAVDRIMTSILRDRRHTEIEVLDKKRLRERAFADWSMKLAMPGAGDRGDIIAPPPGIVESLQRAPHAAPSFLVKLFATGPEPDALEALASFPVHGAVAEILRGVMLSAVIPQLARQGRAAPEAARPILPHARTADLAQLLIATDRAACLDLIEELRADDALPALYPTLFEPAARRLGDLWRDDDCSEFDVTLGLCRLQSAVQLLGQRPVRVGPRRRHPLVLVAPEPGELHRLGAALDSDVLAHAGWSPTCECPVDDQALRDLVAGHWFDALALSLSASFSREDQLPRLSESIAQARRASLNPDLVVIVAGRAFVDRERSGQSVGADLATTSSLDVDRSILRLLDPDFGHDSLH